MATYLENADQSLNGEKSKDPMSHDHIGVLSVEEITCKSDIYLQDVIKKPTSVTRSRIQLHASRRTKVHARCITLLKTFPHTKISGFRISTSVLPGYYYYTTYVAYDIPNYTSGLHLHGYITPSTMYVIRNAWYVDVERLLNGNQPYTLHRSVCNEIKMQEGSVVYPKNGKAFINRECLECTGIMLSHPVGGRTTRCPQCGHKLITDTTRYKQVTHRVNGEVPYEYISKDKTEKTEPESPYLKDSADPKVMLSSTMNKSPVPCNEEEKVPLNSLEQEIIDFLSEFTPNPTGNPCEGTTATTTTNPEEYIQLLQQNIEQQNIKTESSCDDILNSITPMEIDIDMEKYVDDLIMPGKTDKYLESILSDVLNCDV